VSKVEQIEAELHHLSKAELAQETAVPVPFEIHGNNPDAVPDLGSRI
jgi:hypothetical protein